MKEMHSPDNADVLADVVIVYGALRSGTTMLRLMLDGHAGLSCQGESDFLFDHLAAENGAWRYDRRKLELDRIYRASPMQIPDHVDGTAALAQMIEQTARRKPGSRPVLVLHRHPERALTLLPNAKVIHLLRDPRDVARSAIGMGWAGTVFHGLGSWIGTEDGWAAAVSRNEPVVCDVHYEDVVTRPEATLTEICTFLGLDFDRGMLEYDAHSTYDKPDARLTYQWKRKLTPRQIRQVEARLGSRLQRAGYAPSGLPPLRMSRAERLWLALRNTVSTKLHLIRRYGPGNVLQRKIARMFGLHGLEARAQGRMDQITLRHLK